MVRTEIRVPCRDGDIRRCLHAGMLCWLRFAGKRTRRRLRLVTCCPFRIKLERNDVSEVVLLHRGADLTLRATHELTPNQAAILQFQRICLRKGRPSHRATTNPQFSFNFTLTSPLRRSCFLLLVQVDWESRGSHDRAHLALLGHLSGFLFRDQVGPAPAGLTVSRSLPRCVPGCE